MAWTDNIQTALDNTSALLAEITATPKPSYSVHGHTFSWAEYKASLVADIDKYLQLLAQGEPFEIIGTGR